MADNDWNLADAYYQELFTVAWSAGPDLRENCTKDDIVEPVTTANVTYVGHNELEMDGELLK